MSIFTHVLVYLSVQLIFVDMQGVTEIRRPCISFAKSNSLINYNHLSWRISVRDLSGISKKWNLDD